MHCSNHVDLFLLNSNCNFLSSILLKKTYGLKLSNYCILLLIAHLRELTRSINTIRTMPYNFIDKHTIKMY